MSYDDFISGASNDFGVPVGIIKSVIQVESSGNPFATGTSGEKGLMQIMPATGRDLGLKNFYDPESNIRAGTKYLSQQYKVSGNWRDALAKYNGGKHFQGSQAQGYADKVLGNMGGSGHEYQAANGDGIKSGGDAELGGGGAAGEGDGDDKPWYEKIIDYLLGLLKKGGVKILIGMLAVLIIIFGVWKLINS